MYPISFHSFIWSESEYYKNLTLSHQILGIFFGAYIILIFFLLISLVYYPQRVLFYFFIYNLLFAFYLFLDVGMYWMIVPHLGVDKVSVLLSFIPVSAVIAGFLFLERFYKLRLKRSIGFFAILLAIFVFVAFIFSQSMFHLGFNVQVFYSYLLFFLCVICIMLIMSFVTIRLILNTTQRNFFLFIGIFVKLFGVLILTSNSLDVLPTIHIRGLLAFETYFHINWYLPSLIFIGVLIEIIVFILILYDGIKHSIVDDTNALYQYSNAKVESLNALVKGELQVRSNINQAMNSDIVRPLLDVDLELSNDPSSRHLRDEIHEVIGEMNLIISNLQQEQHANESIKLWIESFFLQLQKLADIQITTNIEEINTDDLAIKDTICKVIQESVNNVIKWAKAKAMSVDLKIDEKGFIILKIEDNGVGLDIANLKKNTGLFSMYQRVQNVDGTLTLKSKIGEGLKLLIKIPFHD